MLRHQGVLVDVARRTHRDREGRVTPLDELVRGGSGLYFAGRFPEHPRFRAYQRWMLPAEGWVAPSTPASGRCPATGTSTWTP